MYRNLEGERYCEKAIIFKFIISYDDSWRMWFR